ERRDLVPQVEVDAGRIRRAGQPAAPGNGERVTPWGRQPPIGEQSIPRNLTHTVHGALDERARRARADGGQFHVYERGMGSDDGEPDARGARGTSNGQLGGTIWRSSGNARSTSSRS